MRILVLGSGGREHALIWKLKASPRAKALFCIPGNAGIQRLAECPQVEIQARNGFAGLFDWIEQNRIHLTVVGPEAPLADGIVDAFQKRFGMRNPERLIFGPVQNAAQLEASKCFCKEFLERERIPTARARTCLNREEVVAAQKEFGLPIVLKADGLASGKGVWVCQEKREFEAALHAFFEEERYGQAARKVLVEEYLEGEEVSFLAICDGEQALAFPSSQDHKRVLDGDRGPNTGGMGAYSPAPALPAERNQEILDLVINPTLRGMKKMNTPYVGVLYAGLMMTDQGPKVLEFNCRFGDPETQALLMRFQSDLASLFEAAVLGTLANIKLAWDPCSSVCVVMASQGYPGHSESGLVIEGLDAAKAVPHCEIFHAGTALRGEQIVNAGGRVLGITALGKNLQEAVATAYQAVAKISWPGAHFRKDIGKKGLTGKHGKI